MSVSSPPDSDRPRRELVPLVVPPILLEGQAVRLEPLRLSHAPALAALCEDDIFTWMTTVLRTEADVEAFIASALAAAEQGTERPFVILERETGTPVGTTRYLDIQRHHRTLEIGSTWLGRRVWRTRVNTECKYLHSVIDTGWPEVKARLEGFLAR